MQKVICLKNLFELLLGMATTKNGFYAVKVGKVPGIYMTWEDCRNQVNGFSGAIFKKFPTKEAATTFIYGGNDVNRIRVAKAAGEQRNASSYAALNGIIDLTVPDEFSEIKSPPIKAIELELKKSERIESYENAIIECHAAVGSLNCQPMKKRNLVDRLGDRKRRRTCYTEPHSEQVTEGECSGDSVAIYTDGACAKNGRKGAHGGIGVYWGPDHPLNISEKLFGRQTNNRAEIMAAARALEQAKSIGKTNVTLYTDSNFLIQGITKWIYKWKQNGWKLISGGLVKNREDFEYLDKARKGLNVKWVHVRGHHGVQGNEAADELARKAAN